MKKVTAIICAFNEENTIKSVIQAISKALIVSEIIVVNDGSTDYTGEIIRGIKSEIEIIDIHLEVNKGKGYAMAVGVEHAGCEIILFIDADLLNIDTGHINQLVNPLLMEEADMVLGQPTETLINYSINPFKSFTGERALLKVDLLPITDKMKSSRFGVETLLNLYYQSEGKIVKYVMLIELEHPTKYSKTSSIIATKELIYEGGDIAMTTIKNFDLIIKILKNIK